MHAKSPDLPEFQVVILGTNLIQDDCPDLCLLRLYQLPQNNYCQVNTFARRKFLTGEG